MGLSERTPGVAPAASGLLDPRTGEKIHIAASKQAKFKAGKRLRDELN